MGSAKQHEDFYGCRVEFENPNISIVFEHSVLDVELPLGATNSQTSTIASCARLSNGSIGAIS